MRVVVTSNNPVRLSFLTALLAAAGALAWAGAVLILAAVLLVQLTPRQTGSEAAP